MDQVHRLIALDFETEDLSAKYRADKRIWGFALTEKVGGQYTTDAYEWNFKNIEHLRSLASDESVIFIIHNSSFDVAVSRTHGIDIRLGSYLDTQLLAYVLQPMTGMENFSLGKLARLVGDEKIPYRKALMEAGLLSSSAPKGAEFAVPYNPIMEEYVKQDSLLTYKLWEYLFPFLQAVPPLWWTYFNLELPYVEVIMEMEQGSYVDREFLFQLREETALRLDTLEKEILSLLPLAPKVSWNADEKQFVAQETHFKEVYEKDGFRTTWKRNLTAHGKLVKPKDRITDVEQYSPHYSYEFSHCKLHPFSPSSDQLPWYFMEHGWKPGKDEWTDSGRPAIGNAVLSKIKSPLTEPVIEYLDLSKLKSTYIDALIEASDYDGYVRGNYIQTGTITTRLASSKPNLQNIDPRVKPAFIAPPGYVLAVADLDAIEVAVLAFFLETLFGDSGMSDQIRAGVSPHTYNAKLWDITRAEAKTTLFGLVYGQTEHGLALKLGVTTARARQILEQVYTAMPALLEFKEWVVRKAKSKRKYEWLDLNQDKYVNTGFLTTLLGHRMYYPEVHSTEQWKRSRAERQLGNVIIQGSAGEIFKYLHLQVWRHLRQTGSGRCVFAVHDEGGVYIKDTEATECRRGTLTELMRSQELLKEGSVMVPVTSEFLYGISWDEAKNGNYCNIRNKERWEQWNTSSQA